MTQTENRPYFEHVGIDIRRCWNEIAFSDEHDGLIEKMHQVASDNADLLSAIQEKLNDTKVSGDQEIKDHAMIKCNLIKLCESLALGNACLELGFVEQALAIGLQIQTFETKDLSSSMKKELVRFFNLLIWNTMDFSQIKKYMQLINELDESGEYNSYFSWLNEILKARQAIEENRINEAISICEKIIRGVSENDDFYRIALEALSGTYRVRGDIGQELRILNKWLKSIQTNAKSPCELAQEIESQGYIPGLFNYNRWEDILCIYSRLAEINKLNQNKRIAQDILSEFIETGYGQWVSPDHEEKITISERLDALKDKCIVSTGDTEFEQLLIKEPERRFGEIDQDSMSNIFENIHEREGLVGIVLRPVETKEDRFRFNSSLGSAIDQIYNIMGQTTKITDNFSLTLFDDISYGEKPGKIIIIRPSDQTELSDGICWGLKCLSVNNEVVFYLNILSVFDSSQKQHAQEICQKLCCKMCNERMIQSINKMILKCVQVIVRRLSAVSSNNMVSKNREGW